MTKFSVSTVLSEDSAKTFNQLTDGKLSREISHSLSKCEYNKAKLEEYYRHITSQGLALTSINNRLKVLRYFFNYVKKPYNKITKEDIEHFLVEGWDTQRTQTYSNGVKITRTPKKWSARTQQLYKLSILYFYIWSSKIGKYDPLPEHVNWIKRKRVKLEYIENILSREEVKRILENAICTRDKCAVNVLYDAALRISELAGIRIKDIEFDSYGASVKVSGKTGERKIRLVDSVPAVKHWLNEHPFKDDRNKELFICLRSTFGKPMLTSGIYKVVQNAVQRAKINKKVHPHLFRHSKLTHMAEEGFNEMELRVFAGWTKSSPMPEVYLHIGAKELDEKIRRKNGMITEDEEKKIEKDKLHLKNRVCPMCEEKNDVTNKFCYKCGQILDVRAIRDIEKVKEPMVGLLDETTKKKLIEELKKNLLADILKEVKK